MLYSRWLALGIFFVLLLLITFYDKEHWKGKLRYYSLTFIEGMVGGFIIDCVGISAGYYHFPRQPFLSMEYFYIVIPCWGVFGLLVNSLWKWIGKEKFLKGMAVTLAPLFVFYEGSNLITGSWVYSTPFYAVVLGWMPLIWVFAGCNRRRRVIFKLEEWKLMLGRESALSKISWYALTGVRILLTVAMFPLMIAVIIRLLIDMPILIKRDVNIVAYARCLLAM